MADLLSQVQALLANLVLKTVQFRRSFTAGYRPTVLAEGEPFVQFADRRLIFGGANGGPQVEVPFDGGGSGGPGIVSGAVNGSGHLILTRSDGSTLDVGYVVGAPGSPGASGSPGAAGRGIASVVVNGSNRLIVTYTDGSTQDAGPVSGGSGGGPSNTDGLPEGTTNLYFTAGRARASISVAPGSGLTYNATTGAIGYALPAPTTTTLGGVRALAAVAKTFLTGIGTDGVPTAAQPAFSDLTGTAAPAQLPNPTTTTLGGVKALAAVTSQWIRSIGTDGTPTASQPAFGDISGSVAAAQLPAFTGDVTSSAGSSALTIPNGTVTNAKRANMAANTLSGNNTGTATSPADLTVAQVKTLLAYALSELTGLLQAAQFPALTGAITTAAGSLATTLSAGAVAFSNLASAAVGTAADLYANAASKLVSVAALWASQVFVTLTDAATIAVDMSAGINFKVTLAGNRTLGAPTNAKEGQSGVIQFIQDGTGSRTLAFATAWDFGSAGTPTLSTAAGKIDTISYVVISTTGPVVRAYFGKSA